MIRRWLVIMALLWAPYGLAASCTPQTSRALLTQDAINAPRTCLLEAVSDDRSPDWVRAAQRWLLVLDHLDYVLKAALREPVALRSVRERGWLADAQEAAQQLVLGVDAGELARLAQKADALLEQLPLRRSDPRVTGYTVAPLETGQGLQLHVDGHGLAGAQLVASARKGEVLPVVTAEERATVALPLSWLTREGAQPGWQIMTLRKVIRHRMQQYTLIVPRAPATLARYTVRWKKVVGTRESRTVVRELPELASTIMDVRQRVDSVCVDEGWRLDRDSVKVEVLEAKYGEIEGYSLVGERCVQVRLKAKPFGGAFGSKYLKRGFVQARVVFDESRGESRVVDGKPVQGEITWLAPVQIRLPEGAKRAELDIRWFDGTRETRLLGREALIKWATLKALGLNQWALQPVSLAGWYASRL